MIITPSTAPTSAFDQGLPPVQACVGNVCFLVVMAFLTKQSETYSRLLVGQLFVIGYFAQLFLHFAVRELQKRWPMRTAWTMR
jgi:hypothetical protein